MNQTGKIILSIVGLTLLVYLLWVLKILIVYLLISVVLSLIIGPIAGFFHRRRVWKWHISYNISVVLAMGLLIALVIGFVNIFMPVLIEQTRVIGSIQPELISAKMQAPLQEVENIIKEYSLLDLEGKSTSQYFQEELLLFISRINIANMLTGMFSAVGSVFIAIFSILFISFFFIKDRDLFVRMVFSVTPGKYMKQVKEVLRSTKHLLRRYFVGILIQVSAITLLVSVGLSIMGVKYALAIGFFAGVINVIPYIGPLIGTLFGVALSFTTYLDVESNVQVIPLLIKVLSVFGVVQLLDNFVFQPFIFSNSVRSHPLEIFLVIMAAASFAGVPGMVLAVPTYTFIRIIAKAFLSQFKIVKVITKDI